MTLVWQNGRIVRDGAIDLPADNRAVSLGDGLFETVLMVNGAATFLEDHMVRLRRSAEVLGLAVPEEEVIAAVRDLGHAGGGEVAALRLRLLRGMARHGLSDDGAEAVLVATLSPLDLSLIGKPARLATVSIRRNPQSVTSTHKTLSYLDAIAAMREAARAGADGALMLNTQGLAASAAIANLFLLKGDSLVTPSLDQGILPGTTRARLLRGAGALGLRGVERPVDRSELVAADAVFLTNALRIVTPVTHIDNHPTGTRDCRFVRDHLAPKPLLEFLP